MTFSDALPFILVGLALLVLVVALFYFSNRKTNVVASDKRDVLDEGAAPAARNQALIDAPRSVEQNVGATSAAANSDTIAAAGAAADAEAGAVVQPTVTPTPPAPAPAPTPGGTSDDLTTIKGVGPKLVTLLNEQGNTSFAQIAAWTDADIARVDAQLGRFKGRITRDNWVEQAKLLASGDESGSRRNSVATGKIRNETVQPVLHSAKKNREDTMSQRILVAEDELIVAFDLCDTVAEAGFEVVGPHSGISSAMLAFQKESPTSRSSISRSMTAWFTPLLGNWPMKTCRSSFTPDGTAARKCKSIPQWRPRWRNLARPPKCSKP